MATVQAAPGVREKIRFEYGRPETVVLRHATGRLVPGVYGEQFMFSTVDDRIFFLDGDIARLVEECPGAAQGHPIQITRSKGPRNTTNWDVRPAAVNGPRAVVYAQPVQQPSELETRLQASIVHAQASREVHAERFTEPLAQQPITAPQAKLLAALCVAIDCAVEAEVYAKRRNFPLMFTSEDVRTMANTVMINAEKGR